MKTILQTIPASLILLLLTTHLRADDRPVHIFILSGQSNMAGMDPKLGFEPEADTLFPDSEVVYIKIARGGQPIRFWVAEWDEIAARHGIDVEAARANDNNRGTMYYEPILKQYRELLEDHPRPASVTFCWMQGERDARTKLSAAYEDALKQLIANLRRDLEQPEMNFVIGRLSDFGGEDDADWQKVRDAQVQVARDDDHGAWVDCDDLNNKVRNGVMRDDLHYTREGYELLGRRYVRQGRALIEQTDPADDGRPE